METTDDYRKELKCIGLRIAYFRKLKNITQATLAKKLSINKNYSSHIESDSANKAVSLPLLIFISKALDVELSLLTDLSDLNKNNFGEFVKDIITRNVKDFSSSEVPAMTPEDFCEMLLEE